MFQHRTNSKKPSTDFLAHFKQEIWDSGPMSPYENSEWSKETAFVEAPYNHDTDDGVEERQWPSDDISTLPTLSAFSHFWELTDLDSAYGLMSMPQVGHTDMLADADVANDNMMYSAGISLSSPTDESFALDDFICGEHEVPQTNLHYSPLKIQIGSSCAQGSVHDGILWQDAQSDTKYTFDDHQVGLETIRIPSQDDDPVPRLPKDPNLTRFRVVLGAPTATQSIADEALMTYLNREQPYIITIVDTTPSLQRTNTIEYLTTITIAFDDERQRQSPSQQWSLWQRTHASKSANGIGSANGIEPVSLSLDSAKSCQRTKISHKAHSVDEFSFTWSTDAVDLIQCEIGVRLHFVSTDFSHAKGIKGCPLRLCATTKTATPDSSNPQGEYSEMTYCLIKVFRNHGAERKMANDSAHIVKKITKIQKLMNIHNNASIEKIKPRCLVSEKGAGALVPKRNCKRRKLSMENEVRANHELAIELERLRMIPNSGKVDTTFDLRGRQEDWPNICYSMVESPDDTSPLEHIALDGFDQSPFTYCDEPSDILFPMENASTMVTACLPAPIQPILSKVAGSTSSSISDSSNSSPSLIRVAQNNGWLENERPTRWINVIDIDGSYRRPIYPQSRAALCIFVQWQNLDQSFQGDYYRSVYLKHRTTKGLISGIASKCNLEALNRIDSAFHVTISGNRTKIDDHFVTKIMEGQDMKLKITITEGEKILDKPHEADGMSPSGEIWDGSNDRLQLNLIY